MCQSCGRCVAITLIVFGVLILAGGILTLLGRQILDCDDVEYDWSHGFHDYSEWTKEFCDMYEEVARTAGIVSTSIGGVMVVVGITMLCCLRNKQRLVAAPQISVIQPGLHPAAPPNYPYANQQMYQQYQNPMMQQQQYHNPMMQQQQYSKNPLAAGQGGYPPHGLQSSTPAHPELSHFSQHS